MKRTFALFALIAVIAIALSGCGGGGSGGTPNPTVGVITISISPTSFIMSTNSNKTFTATVTGTSNLGVTWSVQEASGGTVSSSGVYSSPSIAGTFHVIATSQADSSKYAKATVTVTDDSLDPPPPPW